VRVPAFVHAPGRLPQGEDRTSYVHVTDWVPTLLGLAGAPAPKGVDGVDVWPTLENDTPVRKVRLTPHTSSHANWMVALPTIHTHCIRRIA
jgi:arylsulfatase A-like enzyme